MKQVKTAYKKGEGEETKESLVSRNMSETDGYFQESLSLNKFGGQFLYF